MPTYEAPLTGKIDDRSVVGSGAGSSRSFLRVILGILPATADGIAVAVAVALPWSTTATSILAALWIGIVLFALERLTFRKVLFSAAGFLPLLIFWYAVVSMFWADVSWSESFKALHPYLKFIFIPMLLARFSLSSRGHLVLLGFLASCTLLLACSFATAIWPQLWRPDNPGVPVRNQVDQSAEFVVCALCILPLAIEKWRLRNIGMSIGLCVLACLFLINLMYVATSRTELLIIPALFLLWFGRYFSAKMLPVLLILLVVAGTGAWFASPYLRSRVAHGFWEVQQYETVNRPTSAGLRLEWWRKSIGFWRSSPIIGHGVGSTMRLFEVSSAEQSGAAAVVTSNPHNQIFAIAIPLGLIGVIALIGMWVAHGYLVVGSGWLSWIGIVLLTQNLLGCMLNSHLFDFAEGWIYVWGIGVVGGTLAKSRYVKLKSSVEAA